MLIGFVDIGAFSLVFDRVCCVSVRSFWCETGAVAQFAVRDKRSLGSAGAAAVAPVVCNSGAGRSQAERSEWEVIMVSGIVDSGR